MGSYGEEVIAKAQTRQQYTGIWAAEMMKAPVKNPLCCVGTVICPPVASYLLRKQALHGDMRRYACCQGGLPFLQSTSFKASCIDPCPELCLCCEVAFCFPMSVAATRYTLQDEMQIQNTECDNNLIAIMVGCQQLACICQCAACVTGSQEIADCANTISCIANYVYFSVCACMQTQHKIQLDARDRGEYQPPTRPTLVPPGVQAMTQPFPPPGGQGYGFQPPGPPLKMGYEPPPPTPGPGGYGPGPNKGGPYPQL